MSRGGRIHFVSRNVFDVRKEKPAGGPRCHDDSTLLGRVARQPQRGVSLFVVLVMVLLTTLMTLWAARTALFNEMITGNDSGLPARDGSCTRAGSRTRKMDILGQRPDGQPCNTTTGAACRPLNIIDIAGKKAYFPSSSDQGTEIGLLTTALAPSTPSCVRSNLHLCQYRSRVLAGQEYRCQGPCRNAQGWCALRPVHRCQCDSRRQPVAHQPDQPNRSCGLRRIGVEPIQYRAIGLKGPTQDYAPFGSGASTTATGRGLSHHCSGPRT